MQAIDRMDFSNNWITLIFLGALLLLVVLKTVSQKKLFGYITSFFNRGFLVKTNEERGSFLSFFNVVLLCFSSVIFAVFIMLLLEFFLLVPPRFSSFTAALGIVFVYVLLFQLVTISLSKVFDIQNEIGLFLVSRVTYFHTTALLLFPILVVVVYNNLSVLLLFAVGVFLFLISRMLFLLHNKNLIVSQLFYFILYLCALEIAPLLIMYKAVF